MKTKILASLFLIAALVYVVGCEREVTETIIVEDNTECFQCHGDNGYLLQAKGEWANSVHASGNSVDYTNRLGTDCTRCHNHQGFQEYMATGEISPPYDSVSAIHCFTCHSPHLTGTMAVDYIEPTTLLDGTVFNFGNANICSKCHQARTIPDDFADNYEITSSRFGPHHGPQGDLIAHTLGYEIVGTGYSYPNSNHGGAVGEACVSCHMGNPGSTHEGYHIGGHSWNMTNEDDSYELVGVCVTCHTEATHEFAEIIEDTPIDYDNDGDDTEGFMSELDGVWDSIGVILQSRGWTTGSGSTVSGSVIPDKDMVGVIWNYRTYLEDRSHGAHNPSYIKALLLNSWDYAKTWDAANKAPQAPTTVASH